MAEFPIHILCDPTSSASGKFYLGVECPQQPFGLYGANTSNNAGTITKKDTVAKLQKLLNDKRKKGYKDTDPSSVSKSAIQNMLTILSTKHNIKLDSLSIEKRGSRYVIIDGKKSTSGPRQSARPKVRKVDYQIWI